MSVIDPFTGKPFDESEYGIHTHGRQDHYDSDIYSPLNTLVGSYEGSDTMKTDYYEPAIKALLEFFERQRVTLLTYDEYFKQSEKDRLAAYAVFCEKLDLWNKYEQACLEAEQKWKAKSSFVKFFVNPAYPKRVEKPVWSFIRIGHPLTWDLPSVKCPSDRGMYPSPLIRLKRKL